MKGDIPARQAAERRSYTGPPRRLEREGLFALEQQGDSRFVSQPLPSALIRLYGGQVMAQALMAAQRTVEEGKRPANCHAMFQTPGDIAVPISFDIERDSDGRSFSARRIVARQGDAIILAMNAMFHVEEPDAPSHGAAMPQLPEPETLTPMEEVLHASTELAQRHEPFWLRDHIFDWRPVQTFRVNTRPPEAGEQQFWVRLKEPWQGPAIDHFSLTAYLTDLHLLHVGLAPLGIGFASDHLQTASLDHSVWFHRAASLDDWMLYSLTSPSAAHSVALGTGNLFTRDGQIVASTAQSGLIRLHDKARTGKL